MIVNQSPRIRMFNQDCMDFMKNLPNNAYQLAIVDPPYGINAPNMSMGTHKSRTKDGYPGESVASKLKKGRLNQGSGKLKDRILNTSSIDWDQVPGDEYFNELRRVSVHQIIFGGNYFNLPPTRCVLCWDKRQPWKNFSQWEMMWTSFDRPAAIFRYSNTGGANSETKIHPTQKPVKLYRWLLCDYANPGDKILSTHGGSGSDAIACLLEGFDLDWMDSDTKLGYYPAAIKRFNQVAAQGVLF